MLACIYDKYFFSAHNIVSEKQNAADVFTFKKTWIYRFKFSLPHWNPCLLYKLSLNIFLLELSLKVETWFMPSNVIEEIKKLYLPSNGVKTAVFRPLAAEIVYEMASGDFLPPLLLILGYKICMVIG